MSYFRNLWSAFVQDGADLDVTENLICDGKPGMTISMRCALAQQAGKLWGHLACLFLSIVVQRHHCRDQLAGKPMTNFNYVRAGAALTLIPVLLLFSAWLLIRSVP